MSNTPFDNTFNNLIQFNSVHSIAMDYGASSPHTHKIPSSSCLVGLVLSTLQSIQYISTQWANRARDLFSTKIPSSFMCCGSLVTCNTLLALSLSSLSANAMRDALLIIISLRNLHHTMRNLLDIQS